MEKAQSLSEVITPSIRNEIEARSTYFSEAVAAVLHQNADLLVDGGLSSSIAMGRCMTLRRRTEPRQHQRDPTTHLAPRQL